MRLLAVLAVLATVLWGGYWFAGRAALDRAIAAGLAQSPAAEVGGYAIRGFPNRFDVTFDAPRLTLGATGWSAPFFQVFALSYRPHHLLAVFANDQRLTAPGIDATLHSADLRASVVMQPALDLPLDRVSLVGEQVVLALAGDHHQADRLRLASRRLGETLHQAVAILETVIPDPAAMDRIDPARAAPRRIDLMRLDAEVETDRPLDRHLVQGAPPALRRVTLTGATLRFEGVAIEATGRLTPDARGVLSGEVALTVTGWREAMRRAREAGLMPAEHDALIAMATQGLVSREDPDRLEAAFSVTEGDVRLGPILVGTLPPLPRLW